MDIQSFQAVTGPKSDLWLVKTVGALISTISLPILVCAVSGRILGEIILLAVASAAVLGAVDVIYCFGGVISPVYLADAALEAMLLCLWLYAYLRYR